MSYDRDPIDDYDARVQNYWYHRNRQIDREYELEQLARENELTRTHSSEALLAREGISVDPSEDLYDEESYERLPFEADNPAKVAYQIERFASQNTSRTLFGIYKQWALEAIDKHLPPSDSKEEVYEEVLAVETLDQSTQTRLTELAESIRDGTVGISSESEIETDGTESPGRRWLFEHPDWSMTTLVPTNDLVLTGLKTLNLWSRHILLPKDRFEQHKQWLKTDIEQSTFPSPVKQDLLERVDALEHRNPMTFVTLGDLVRTVEELDSVAD